MVLLIKIFLGKGGVLMKQVIALLFLRIFLCSCGEAGEDKPKATPQFSENEKALDGDTKEDTGNNEKEEPVIVVDETGKEHILKLGHMDMKDAGHEFPFMLYPTNYSEVVNNHYYFLRADGKRNYTVYRDKGEKVGKFSLKEGIVKYFTYYNNKFYALVAESYYEYGQTKLMEIDLKNQNMVEVNYLTQKGKKKKDSDPLMLYKGAYFYYDQKDNVGVYDLEGSRSAIQNICSDEMLKGPCIDDKIYYEKISGKTMKIFSYDLKSHKREKVLEFEGKHKKDVEEGDYLFRLEFDSDYIYCNGYLIPRRGGKIVRISYGDRKKIRIPDYLSEYYPLASYFIYNNKFIFYIDVEKRIHRMDKATLEDIIISDPDKNKIYAMDIRCTDTGLYVQNYKATVSMDDDESNDDNDFYESDSEMKTSCDLYYMDLNGEHIEKIWKGDE